MLYRWPLIQTENELRDFIVAAVRNGIDDPKQREKIAAEIERHWQLNERDTLVARHWQAHAMKQELADIAAARMPFQKAEKAREALAKRYGQHSVAAMRQVISRNF
jgi:hypothetical protein